MKQKVLNSYIYIDEYKNIISEIISFSNNNISTYICVANVHMLIEAYKYKDFENILNKSVMCVSDGMPIVFALRILYGIKQQRVAGMDLLPDLLTEAENRSIPIYFYGGTSTMLNSTSIYICKNYPKILLAGLFSPAFRPSTISETELEIQRINESGARLLFVVLGCPKQEKWMASMQGKINMPMIGIGGALPVLIGLQTRAPLWMQRFSLEWLYRFLQEPRRLWKRYLVSNTLFIILFLREFIRYRIMGVKSIPK